MAFDAANNSPSVFQNTMASGDVATEFLLTVATGCTYTFTGVIDSMAINSTAGGDSTITMNFQMAGGLDTKADASAIEAWDES